MTSGTHDLDDCWDAIHGQLYWMPVKYCEWKITETRKKTVYTYEQEFAFIRKQAIRTSLAGLRLSLDYQSSLLKLHHPGLVFKVHHYFVVYQIIAQLYEGILLDIYEKAAAAGHIKAKTKNKIDKAIANNGHYPALGTSLNALIEAGFDFGGHKDAIEEVKDIRDRIHTRKWSNKIDKLPWVDDAELQHHRTTLQSFVTYAQSNLYGAP